LQPVAENQKCITEGFISVKLFSVERTGVLQKSQKSSDSVMTTPATQSPQKYLKWKFQLFWLSKVHFGNRQ